MTSELKAAAIVAIHGNDESAFVELEPKSFKPMSEDDLLNEAKKCFRHHWDIYHAVNLAKRYAASQRGM